MKNAINYYYNLVSKEIHQQKNNYYFFVDNQKYLLMNYSGNIKLLENIYMYFKKNMIYCHEIIINKDGYYISSINNEYFILLKILNEDRMFEYNDIYYTIFYNEKRKCDWFFKWCDKLDYYEYQISQFDKKYKELSSSFLYYSGLTENAIWYVKNVEDKEFDMYINHYKIKKGMTVNDYYNPALMTIDSRVRDVAEYYKKEFFYNKLSVDKVYQYVYNAYLSNEEMILLFSRLLYPSYYFDIYDEIFLNNDSFNKLSIIIKKVNDYELFLKDIWYFLNNIYQMPEIDWIIKT